MGIPSNPIRPGTTVHGRVSWFGGPGDSTDSGHTASGGTTATPGIALYNRATLGGYWLVTAPNGRRAVVRQTDLGPAPFTGRAIDFTYSSLGHFGYNQGNFPTDAVAKATYLGRSVPGNLQHLTAGSGPVGSTPVQQQGPSSFQSPVLDTAGFQNAERRYLTGNFLSQTAHNNPWGTSGGSGGLGALFSSGALTTTPPNVQDFQHQQTFKLAQSSLQRMAGPSVLKAHPSVGGPTSGIAGGFLPRGAQYVVNRKDQGRDGKTNPGGAIVAPGDGYVVSILSDPSGFGPRYPVVHFTSGKYAGRTLYLGHTLAVVRSGQHFRAGQTLSHTGTSGVGNATVPGWFEIGYADSGSPGPFGQPVPF